MKENEIVLLHNHTKKSLLDSILNPEDMVNFCLENNYHSIALTDHGNMFEFVNFYKCCLNVLQNIVKKYGQEHQWNKKQIKDVQKLLPRDKSIKDELQSNIELIKIKEKYPELIEECIDKEIKPIIGCEVYEVSDLEDKKTKQKRHHLILLAKNTLGLKNLFKIVSHSFLKGFYYKPRIDLNYIQENNLGEGIICLTACQAGKLSRILTEKYKCKNKKHKRGIRYVKTLQNIFDYVSIEIQSHPTDSQINANTHILDFCKKYKLPFVVTTDSHMAKPTQLEAHGIFIQIAEDREVGEMYEGCYLQNTNDIHNYMDKSYSENIVTQAILESQNISNMIEWVDVGLNNGNQMPMINIPKQFKNSEEYLKYLVFKDFDKKFSHLNRKEQEVRKERINSELPVLYAVKYTDYFIMLYLLANEFKKRKIPIGYSRGSGANCLCLYMLGVTQIDSVRWGLDFSRFANLGRTAMADFDWDISQARRKEAVEISCELFGINNVAPICTFNSLSTKVAIRDIGKVLNEKKIYDIPYSIRDEVSKMIPTIKTLNDLGEEEEKEILLKELISSNKKLQIYYDKYPLWFKYVMEIEGSPKSLGRHAAGTIISPKAINLYCPYCLDSEGNPMIQLEMHNAMEDIGLIKMDYLGLKTLDVIDNCLKLSNLSWEDVNIDHLNLNDKEVFKTIYQEGNTKGIFQMESFEAKKMCIEAKTDDVEDVIAINAFNRPGTKDGFPIYIFNKQNPDKVQILHDDLKKIFNTTHSVLLYQEQALQIFRHAGFPEDQVDNARRAIGHKEKDKMTELKEDFSIGLKKIGWNEEQIEEIWALMVKQSEYCFNRGHSVAYGLLSYLTAYLKKHYSVQFMTACLNADSGDVTKISKLINECNNMKIKVTCPDINLSDKNFTCKKDSNTILFGLLPIKGLGNAVVETIINNRPYNGVKNFIDKTINAKKINKGAMTILIKSGAFGLKIEHKEKLLLKLAEYYANEKISTKPYKKVSTFSGYSIKRLKDELGIDEKDKNKRLELFNIEKEKIFHKEQQEKNKKVIEEEIESFKNKYLQDKYLWEFQTLSMFITYNPLNFAYKYVRDFDEIIDGQKCVIACMLVDITRKKSKKSGKPFCYLDLYTPYGIVEATAWSKQYIQFQDLLQKGKDLVILGRKSEGHFYVESIKKFDVWKKEIEKKESKTKVIS